MSTIRLGTRRSALATTQSTWVADRLRAAGHDVELVLVTTDGDRDQRTALRQLGGRASSSPRCARPCTRVGSTRPFTRSRICRQRRRRDSPSGPSPCGRTLAMRLSRATG